MIWRSGHHGNRHSGNVRRFFVDLVTVQDELAGVPVLHVFDEVDQATAELLEAEISAVLDGPPVIDFSECRFIDSSVIAVLIRAYKRYGDRLCIVVPKDNPISRVLEITRLDRRLSPVNTLDEAVAGVTVMNGIDYLGSMKTG